MSTTDFGTSFSNATNITNTGISNNTIFNNSSTISTVSSANTALGLVFGVPSSSNTTKAAGTSGQVYDRLVVLNAEQKIIFTAVYTVCLVVGSLVNLVVAFAIRKTGQWQNQSTFLIMLLSINETMSSLFNNIMYIIFLWFFQQLDFKVGLIMKTTSHLFSYASSLLVCAIGFDHFVRVMYTNRYKTVFTTMRYRLFLTVTFGLAAIQTALNLIGPLFFGEGYGGMLTAPINSLLLVLTLILYFICIHILRSYTRENRTISMESRSLIKMAVTYMSLFAIFHTPPVAYSVCYKTLFIRYQLSDKLVGILTCIIFLCMNLNAIVNAFVFLLINKKARRVAMGSPHENVNINNQ